MSVDRKLSAAMEQDGSHGRIPLDRCTQGPARNMGFYTSMLCSYHIVEAGRPGLVRLAEEGGRHPGITQGRLQAWLTPGCPGLGTAGTQLPMGQPGLRLSDKWFSCIDANDHVYMVANFDP